MGIFKLSLVINYVSSPVLEQWKRTGANEMNSKTIKYIPKITNSKNEYRAILPEDMQFLQTELIRWLSVMGELSISKDADSKWVSQHFWLKRTETLPKGKNGLNSPCSFVSGLLNNLLFGEQRDLSSVQMDSLENLSALIGSCLDGCTRIQFQISIQ
jgi:hypothetical protein